MITSSKKYLTLKDFEGSPILKSYKTEPLEKAKQGSHHSKHKYLKIENGKYIYDYDKMTSKDHHDAAEFHENLGRKEKLIVDIEKQEREMNKHIKLAKEKLGFGDKSIKKSKLELTEKILTDELSNILENKEFLEWAFRILNLPKTYSFKKEELIDGLCELVAGYFKYKYNAKISSIKASWSDKKHLFINFNDKYYDAFDVNGVDNYINFQYVKNNENDAFFFRERAYLPGEVTRVASLSYSHLKKLLNL